MRRMDENGELHELAPGEQAFVDQVETHFQTVNAQLVGMMATLQALAAEGDHSGAAETMTRVRDVLKEAFPKGDPDMCSFALFQANLLVAAHSWTSDVFDAADVAVRMLSVMLPSDHPLRRAPGFSEAESKRYTDRILDLAERSRSTYRTDTGVILESVHAESDCTGFCVIHRPIPGPWSSWETDWDDQTHLMYRVCPHLVRHLAVEEMLRDVRLMLDSEHEHHGVCDCACHPSKCAPVYARDGSLVRFELEG